MEKRRFGNTGLETSVLGFGGFHLCEIPYGTAEKLLNDYLDAGGNYIETAPSYGAGESEIKIGKAVSHRRDEFVLVTKAHQRSYEECKQSIDASLRRLQTDHVDLLLMHAVDTMDTLDQILSDDGAIKAAEEAVREGKAKHIGLSMHGQPDVLIEALKRYPFEAVMSTINYFDVCNFPKITQELIPLANEKGIAIILMKPVGDGYLYRSVEPAFTYAFNQPVSVIVAGANNQEMLDTDLAMANNYPPLSEEGIEDILKDAVELGTYVCRQCGKCMPCPEGVDITGIFRLEGMNDRQMSDGIMTNPADYALRERLKHWFGTKERSIKEYAALEGKASLCTECGICVPKCPYQIDIIRKLKNADYKLAPQEEKIWI